MKLLSTSELKLTFYASHTKRIDKVLGETEWDTLRNLEGEALGGEGSEGRVSNEDLRKLVRLLTFSNKQLRST